MAFVMNKRIQQQFLQDLELSPSELDRRERNRSKVRRSYYRKIVRPSVSLLCQCYNLSGRLTSSVLLPLNSTT